MLFQILFGMTLSFSVFPGVLLTRPLTFIDSDDWNTMLILGLFNLFDVVGRTLGGIERLMISAERKFWLHFFALSRIAIVVLTIMIGCGIFDKNSTAENCLIIFIPIVLAVTNGYVQTIFAVYAAAEVQKTYADDGYS